jgi:hypothetical protein
LISVFGHCMRFTNSKLVKSLQAISRLFLNLVFGGKLVFLPNCAVLAQLCLHEGSDHTLHTASLASTLNQKQARNRHSRPHTQRGSFAGNPPFERFFFLVGFSAYNIEVFEVKIILYFNGDCYLTGKNVKLYSLIRYRVVKG